MILQLAYIVDATGNPVPWNETRWIDEEFNEILRLAMKTVDIPTRRSYLAQLGEIFQERGPIGVAFLKDTWRIQRTSIHNLRAHPTNYDILRETWLAR